MICVSKCPKLDRHGRRRRIGLTLFTPSCRGVRRHGQRDLVKEWPESGSNILSDPFPCSESSPDSFSYPVKCRRAMRSDSHVALTALSAVLWPCKQLLWWPSWRLSRQDLKPNRHLKSRAVTLIFMSRLISVKSFHNTPPWLLLLALSLMHVQSERSGNGDRPRTSHMEALLLFWRRTVTALGLFLGSELPGSDMHHKSSSSFKWNVFTLQLDSISCGGLCSDSQLLTHPPQHVACGRS